MERLAPREAASQVLRTRYAHADVVFLAGSVVPSLPSMVADGIEIHEGMALSRALKAQARRLLDAGPPPWGRAQVEDSRSSITDLIQDLRDPGGGWLFEGYERDAPESWRKDNFHEETT